MNRFRPAAFVAAAILGAPVASWADDDSPSAPQATDRAQSWAIHGQTTVVEQANDTFRSPYRGPNSLEPAANGRETFDVTLYAGARPWRGGEVWIDGEIDQGFGLSRTLGVDGFPSGEAYKVGKEAPYPKLPRLFLRQTIDLGGEAQKVDPDLNQLGGSQTANRVVLTVGKFSVVDVFDTNDYAHDARHDFLNWSVIDEATFDYAANAWGYTYGAAAELYEGRFALRAGAFDLSQTPNGTKLAPTFEENEIVGEVEEDHQIAGQPGKLKITAFLNRGRMGRYLDAVALAGQTGQPADIAAVRQFRSRTGVSFNLQQQVAKDVGVFVKGGIADGSVEGYEFTDIDRTLATGVSVKGGRWRRPDDTFGLAGVINAASSAAYAYLNAGGLGILAGDGQLPHPGPERDIEAYYDIAVVKALHMTVDYQFVDNPAFNRDRGPVSIGAIRLHAQF